MTSQSDIPKIDKAPRLHPHVGMGAPNASMDGDVAEVLTAIGLTLGDHDERQFSREMLDEDVDEEDKTTGVYYYPHASLAPAGPHGGLEPETPPDVASYLVTEPPRPWRPGVRARLYRHRKLLVLAAMILAVATVATWRAWSRVLLTSSIGHGRHSSTQAPLRAAEPDVSTALREGGSP
jgi:hypothetical protein